MHRLPRALTLRHQQQQQLAESVWRHATTNASRRCASRLPRSRPVSQIAHMRSGESVRFQAVRFKKPGFGKRQLITIALYGGTFYVYWRMISKYLGIEIEELEELDDGAEEEGGEEVEEDDDGYAHPDSTFIPLTWPTKLPRTFYRGSDPEWQEFIKVAKDQPRHTRIQNELVQLVYRESIKHPGVARQLGKDTKVGKWWLDISFPDGPPQEYERSGIEISDTYIAWSQQRMSPENHFRMVRALWPKAAFDSLYATGRVLAGINYRRMKQALGWEGKDPFSPEERMRLAIETHNKRHHPNESSRKQVGQGQLEPNASPDTVSGSGVINPAKSTSDEEKKLRSWMVDVPMPSGDQNSLDVPIAMIVMQNTLRKQWNPKNMEPPRGTFVVHGLVEVRGQRGRMKFDVRSCYDPKAGKFTSVNANVRSFKLVKQAPRGGP